MADETSLYLNPQLYEQFKGALGTNSFYGGVGNQYIDTFRQAFKTLTGNDPTTPDIANFIQNAGVSSAALPGDLSYGDMSSLVNNYIQQTYPQNVSGYAQQQQMDQLGKTQNTIQDLISKQTAATAKDLTDPNSPTYQSFSGLMNNLGITPSSGAFQAGMGGVLGQSAANAENAALGGVTLPVLSGIQGLSGYGLQQAQGQSNLGHLNQLGDFGLQSQLAQMLADQARPSNFQTAIGDTSALLKGVGGAAEGSAALAKVTWICTAMCRAGAMTPEEVNTLHDHLFRALWKKPWKFLGYFLFGKILVGLANSVNTNWNVWKPSFYDDIMRESDPVKAVALYEDAFWTLFSAVRYRLQMKWEVRRGA